MGRPDRRVRRHVTRVITLRSVRNRQAATAGPRPGYGPLPTSRARWLRARLSTARTRILDVLIDQPAPCTVSALSALTRQHPNTIREHLDGLADERLAVRTRAPAVGRGRPAWLFSAAPEVGFEPGARGYAGLASALAAHIARTSRQPRADSIEAGLLWGRGLVRRSTATEVVTPAQASAPTVVASEGAGPGPKEPDAVSARREVITLLEELGFAPSPDARAGVVKLRRCPLLKAAHQHPAVVCGVHLGVVRGALDELGADPEGTERTSLQAFSEPGACRLDLLPRRGTPL